MKRLNQNSWELNEKLKRLKYIKKWLVAPRN